MVTCSGPPSEFELVLLVTPPVMLRSGYRSRLTSGRFSTSFCPTVRDSDGRRGVDERRVADDRHRFADRAELDRRVDSRVAPDFEHDAGLREVLEAGQVTSTL